MCAGRSFIFSELLPLNMVNITCCTFERVKRQLTSNVRLRQNMTYVILIQILRTKSTFYKGILDSVGGTLHKTPREFSRGCTHWSLLHFCSLISSGYFNLFTLFCSSPSLITAAVDLQLSLYKKFITRSLLQGVYIKKLQKVSWWNFQVSILFL